MDETEIYIAGWQSGMQRAIESIKGYSANWLLNGPSKSHCGSNHHDVNGDTNPASRK
jgi:hypothetical protein